MKKLSLKMVALVATMMMANVTVSAQLNDSISMDMTVWYNQTQQLGEVVVKSRMPKTKIKAQVQVKPSRSA